MQGKGEGTGLEVGPGEPLAPVVPSFVEHPLGASGKRVVESLCSEEDKGKGKEIVVARSYPWVQVCESSWLARALCWG